MRHHPLRPTGTVCVLLAAALTVLVVTGWRPLLGCDLRIAVALHAHAVGHPGAVAVNQAFSDWVWDPWTMRALAVVAAGWLWWRGERRLAVRCVAAVAVATLLSQGLKALVERERPLWPDPVDYADYAAYPSGHALTATVVCGLLLWLAVRPAAEPAGPAPTRTAGTARTAGTSHTAEAARTRRGWVARAVWAAAAVSVVGVGFTRVYLGVHWPSDVVAGWLLGVAVVCWALAGARRPQPVRGPSSRGGGQPRS
ncbi:phosphatase PAP2 family protein [Streptomyces sp. NPDC090022]|uniref:phosphatase PAP2 family protein n=1 Tax=Streptomyces sp. NPDC090022 TaxID=3365920 RepID=UPI00381EF8D9